MHVRLSLGIVLTSSSLAFSQNNEPLINEPIIYEFHGDVPPISLTFSDLDRFLKELHHLYSAIPENTENNCTYELAGPKGAVSGPSIEKVFGDDLFLTYANEFHLSCFNRLLRVNSINITLGSSPRWAIKGTDRVLLEAVRSHLDNNLAQAYKTYLGGLLPQSLFAVLFLFLCNIAIYTLTRRFILPKSRTQLNIADSTIVGLIVALSAILAGLLLGRSGIPQSLFPEVAIYRGTASLLERYSPEISFYGLIISLALTVFYGLRSAPVSDQQTVAPPKPPEGPQPTS